MNPVTKIHFGWKLALASLVVSGSIFFHAQAAVAGSASDWVKGNHASSRLVIDTASWNQHDKAVFAGIHVQLDDGWKTYWRNPGDAGLPPSFDWSGSKNLKHAELLWPAPVRFHDSAGTSYGYKKEILFPVRIEALDPKQPVELNLKMEYAVCADICIPVDAALKITSGKSGFFSRSHTALLEKYLQRVPVRIERGNENGIGITKAQAKLTDKNPVLVIDAQFPAGDTKTDLFVEGPEGHYLPPTRRVSKNADGSTRYQVDLAKGDDPKNLKGQTLVLTLVSEKAQAEVAWRVE